MQSEQIQQRIERYTADLPQAVHSPNGARFALLLSLIASSQERQMPRGEGAAAGEAFALESAPLDYPDADELYTAQLAQRLNNALTAGERGEYAYLVSHLQTRMQLPRSHASVSDTFQQVALASSGRMMLDNIDQSRTSIRASA